MWDGVTQCTASSGEQFRSIAHLFSAVISQDEFRRRVGKCASRTVSRLLVSTGHDLGEPHICNLGHALSSEQDVGGLHVPAHTHVYS